MQSEMGIRLTANTDGLRQGVQNAKFLMEDLGNSVKMADASTTPSMAEGVGMGTVSQSPGSFFATKDQYKELIIAINNVTQVLRENGTTGGSSAKAKEQEKESANNAKLFKELSQTAAIALGMYTGYEQYQTTQIRKRMRQMAADPYGAMQEELQGGANVQKTAWNTVGNVVGLGLSFIPAIGPIAGMAASALIKEISSGVISAKTEREIAEIQERQQKVDKYRQRLDVMDESYRKYGGASMWETQGAMLSASKGTGMDIDEFMRAANRFSSYGVTTGERASELTRAAGLAERNTGADLSSITAFLGTQERYGGRAGTDSSGRVIYQGAREQRAGNALAEMNYAYNAALASGLQRNQFGEFLDGLQNVIETGISKGYIKSTKEVSDTMVMFDKLSGGSKFWQGEQGFNRLQSINNGLANATALNSSTQLAVYQAMAGLSGGDMLDTFALMEKGLDVNSFKAISQRFNNIFGGDRYSEVMALKELTGLNYTGAMQLRDMAHGDIGNVTPKMIEDVMKSAQTDQTRTKDALNSIEVQVSKWGSDYFPEYLSMLKKIAGESEVGNNTHNNYVRTVGSYKTATKDEATQYLKTQLDDLTTEGQLRALNSNIDFNTKYGDILNYASQHISDTALKRYEGAVSDEEKAKYRAAAEREAAKNQEVLEMLVEQLKLLVQTNGKAPIVISQTRK